jgi:hypothetical protein
MIPLPLATVAGILDAPAVVAFFNWMAGALGAAAVWAQRKAEPEQDPILELTMRLRTPVRFAIRHPLSAAVSLKRKVDRRRSA